MFEQQGLRREVVVPQVVADGLVAPHELAGRRPQRHDRVGEGVVARPPAAIEVRRGRRRGQVDQVPRGVRRHHGPHVRAAGTVAPDAGPAAGAGMVVRPGQRVPRPGERPVAHVVRAHHPGLETRRAVVADGRAHDDEIADHGGRRRHGVVALAVTADPGGEVDLAVPAEVGARGARAASSAMRRASSVPRNTRSRHRSGSDGGPRQAATPRDVNISLYLSEKSTPGSYVQSSSPVPDRGRTRG